MYHKLDHRIWIELQEDPNFYDAIEDEIHRHDQKSYKSVPEYIMNQCQ